jgi:prophage tail gpP-like protein
VSDINRVLLVVDGVAYEGWQQMRVQRGIEQIAGAFVLQVTLKWAGQDDPYEMREGLPCQVLIGQDVLITGYIDEYEPSYDAENSTITVHGRGKTADLVDCSAIYKTGQWHNVGLLQIVQDIVKPFGIGVVVVVDLDLGDPFKSFALEECEKAFDAIDRACRMRGVLCADTPAGEVLLTLTSNESSDVQLVEGVNIKSAGAKHSWKERYSQVTLKGQSKGDDGEWGATVAHIKAQASDAEINRYRPLVVIAEHGAGIATLKERAQWETKVRMGRGKRGHIEVVGWRTGKNGQEGPLWTPNTLVYINSPRLKLDREMLIVDCEYEVDDKKGHSTKLTFCRPEAFEVIAGIQRSKLGSKINDRTQREKHKRGGKKWNSSFTLDAPTLEGK